MVAPRFITPTITVSASTLVVVDQRLESAVHEFRRAAEVFNSTLSPFTAKGVSRADLDERVNAGVAFLDKRLGREFWLERIDVATLDVASQTDCVVCQVTGISYAVGVELLGGPELDDAFGRLAWATSRGFALRMCLEVDGYPQLTAAWVAKVRELRAKGDSVRVTAAAEGDSVRITA